MLKNSLVTVGARAALVLVAAVAVVTASFTPAQATGSPTLPATQNLYALGCQENPPHLWTIDETNGSSTTFGTSTPSEDCAYATSVNPVDGTVYVEYQELVNGNPVMYLGTLDFSSGVITQIAPISGDPFGLSYMIITNSGDAYGTTFLGSWISMDLSSGVISPIADQGNDLAWVAYNATNDTIYGFRTTSGTTADAFTINRLTGALTADPSHNIVVPSGYSGCPGYPFEFYAWTGATFDKAGNLWFANKQCASTLLVEDFATGTTYVQGDLTDANMTWGQAPRYTYETMVLFLTPDSVPASPTLPDTGANASVTAASLAVSTALLAVGALVLAVTRRRKTQN